MPGSLIWIVLVAGVRALRGSAVTPREILVVGGIVLVLLLVVAFLLPQGSPMQSGPQGRLAQGGREVPTAGSDYPLPPLDLAVPAPPPRRAAVSAAASVDVGQASRQEDDRGTT